MGRRRRDKFYIKGVTPVYAVRDSRGRFVDIQRVSRAAKLDLRKVSKEERRKRRRRTTRKRRRKAGRKKR